MKKKESRDCYPDLQLFATAFLSFDASPPVVCHAPAPAADARSDFGVADPKPPDDSMRLSSKVGSARNPSIQKSGVRIQNKMRRKSRSLSIIPF